MHNVVPAVAMVALLLLLYALNEMSYSERGRQYLPNMYHRRYARALLHALGLLSALALVAYLYGWVTFPMRVACSGQAAELLAAQPVVTPPAVRSPSPGEAFLVLPLMRDA